MSKTKPLKNVVLVLLSDDTFKLISTNLPSSFFPAALSEYGFSKDAAVFITAGVATQKGDCFYIGKLQVGYLNRKGEFYIYPSSIRVFPREPIYNNALVNARLYKTLLDNLKK